MFRRLSNSLTSPKEVAKYYLESFGKTILFFLILLFFMMIPIIIGLVTTDLLPYSKKDNIRDNFSKEEIPFIIEDGIMKNINGDSNYYYINDSMETYRIIFTENIDTYSVDVNEMALVFCSDGVYLKVAVANSKIVQYSDYDYLKNVNFSNKELIESEIFWIEIYTILDDITDSYKPIYVISYSLYYIIYWFMWLSIFCLIMALFSKMRTMGLIKYWELFKMSIYGLTPFIICSVFATLFNLGFLIYIGYIISAIYNIITVNEIIRNNFSSRREGENNGI